MRRWRAWVVAAVAVWGGWSCTDPVRPEPGMLLVVLSGAQPGDAALLFSVQGPDSLGAITGAPGYQVYARTMEGGFRVAVFGAVNDGEILRFAVPDVRRATLWSATLLDVADTANALRASGGYVLAVAR